MNNNKKKYWERQFLKRQILLKYAMGHTYSNDYTRLKRKHPRNIYYSTVNFGIDSKYLPDIKREFKQNGLRLHIEDKYNGIFDVVIKCES